VKLDDIIPHIESRYSGKKIAYWKADVEGYEPRMFRGAKKFFSRYNPQYIGFEILGKSFPLTECSAEKLYKGFTTGLGYDLTDSKSGSSLRAEELDKLFREERSFTVDVLATLKEQKAE